MAQKTVCIGCGQATGPRPRLNRLLDGSTCPSCRDRLLDQLPPVLPSLHSEVDFEEWAEEGGEEPGEDYPRGA